MRACHLSYRSADMFVGQRLARLGYTVGVLSLKGHDRLMLLTG